MTRNRVRFRKDLLEAEFEGRYDSEGKFRTAIIATHWPDGFVGLN